MYINIPNTYNYTYNDVQLRTLSEAQDPLMWLNPPLRLDPKNKSRDLYGVQPKDIPIGSYLFSPSETPEGRLQHFLFLVLILIGS